MKIIMSQKFKKNFNGYEMSLMPPVGDPFKSQIETKSDASEMIFPKLKKVEVLRPIPKVIKGNDFGCSLLTKEEFLENYFDDDDGYGLLATSTGISEKIIHPSQAKQETFTWPSWATHVWWHDQSQ